MANKHSIMHQPNWHPPTTESMKVLNQLPHNFALHQMFENIALPNQLPGVDLSRGSSNGEVSSSPISLSVKDTKKLIATPETSADSQSKCLNPKIKMSESEHSESVCDIKVTKRASPLDSVLERLKPSFVSSGEKSVDLPKIPEICDLPLKSDLSVPSSLQDKLQGVIVLPTGSQDESSDSSTLNVPNSKEEEAISPYNTEDSLDSNKSRRKRKPSKTLRCAKTDEKIFSGTDSFKSQETVTSKQAGNAVEICTIKAEKQSDPPTEILNPVPIERRRSSSLDLNIIPAKTRRKTSSESETIDNIAAMVQEGLKEKEQKDGKKPSEICNDISFVPVSVIKSKEEINENICQESTVSESTTKVPTLVTPAQKKETHFVEIENKLEEMFAGIEDTADPLKTDDLNLEDSKLEDPLLEDSVAVLTCQDNVSSTSNDLTMSKATVKARKSKSKVSKNKEDDKKILSKKVNKKNLKNKKVVQKSTTIKTDTLKEVSYDSSSNASSAKLKGPFLHIKGPRGSPLSVSIVNTPTKDEDDAEKKIKTKKFHDDSEYRHKVRSKGLHCSTLSNKYDAQTKDASWICVFCKKGPHTNERISGVGWSFPSGDLFGPYFVNMDCEEYERRFEDPYDKNFKSKKIIKVLEASKQPPTKKAKKRHSETDSDMVDPYLGIVEITNNSFEVWVHEDCLVWSPGVYLVGPKIIGLQEAVWTSCNVSCIRCNFKGANICCLYRGCMKVAHVWCARSLNWDFNEDCFKTFCDEHRKWDKIG
ncbi:uncharacterized protein LOC123316381 isoform X2 [Coccinella septempunctata]|nr:uncharacterized protein LOC123316381 isoform X2 [Coccinella septempunctata]